MVLGLLSIEALYPQQGPPLPTRKSEEKGLWGRENPSSRKLATASVGFVRPGLRGRAEKCSWEGLGVVGKGGP